MKGGRAQNTLGIKKYNKRKRIKDVSEGPPLRKKAHKNLPPPPSGKERQRRKTLKCAIFQAWHTFRSNLDSDGRSHFVLYKRTSALAVVFPSYGL